MEYKQLPDRIRNIATVFAHAIESKDAELVLSFLSDDCEIELLGIRLKGKIGARKWIDWLYTHVKEIEFVPVRSVIDGNTLFEERVAKARLRNGVRIESRQAEVLLFQDYKVKGLCIYLDRLDFAESFAGGGINKMMARRLVKKSLKGLT
jgi:ketosteroid isomerase-like protein